MMLIITLWGLVQIKIKKNLQAEVFIVSSRDCYFLSLTFN